MDGLGPKAEGSSSSFLALQRSVLPLFKPQRRPGRSSLQGFMQVKEVKQGPRHVPILILLVSGLWVSRDGRSASEFLGNPLSHTPQTATSAGSRKPPKDLESPKPPPMVLFSHQEGFRVKLAHPPLPCASFGVAGVG